MAGDVTYDQTLARMRQLAAQAADEAQIAARRSKDTANLAAELGALKVDGKTLAAAQELAKARADQAKAAQVVAEKAAVVLAALQKRHGGIAEARQGSPQAKDTEAGFYSGEGPGFGDRDKSTAAIVNSRS